MRAFLALNPPATVLREIGRAQDFLRAKLEAQGAIPHGVRWAPPNQIHLTLHFLGNLVPEELAWVAAQMREAVARFPLPEVRLRGFGCFPRFRAPRVIWLGVEDNPRLVEFQGELETLLHARLQVETTERFHPHLTLARIRATRGPAGVRFDLAAAIERGNQDPPPAILWQPASVALVRSDLRAGGPVHAVLSEARREKSGSADTGRAGGATSVAPGDSPT